MAEVAPTPSAVPTTTNRSHSAPASTQAVIDSQKVANGRNRSESSNSSNSAESDSVKDVQVVMRKPRNEANGNDNSR